MITSLLLAGEHSRKLEVLVFSGLKYGSHGNAALVTAVYPSLPQRPPGGFTGVKED